MKPNTTRWPAPAKINLFLHITGQRSDGYHLLQTAFQFLDFADEILLTIRDDGNLQRLTELEGVSAEDDITIKAAALLKKVSGVNFGADIELIKRIPMGGGLGGGSSDAATILLALNQLWSCGLTLKQLADLGLQLGADVPVFIYGKAAWAEGIGEHLTPIVLPETWYLVIKPSVHIATRDIFTASDLERNCPCFSRDEYLLGDGVNVCEPVVVKKYPIVGEVIDWLNQYTPARMTGTGACVFGRFDNQLLAEEILSKLPAEWRGFVAKSLNNSPMQQCLAS